MSRFIPEEIVQDIIRANDIVNIVSEYLTLRKKGKYFVGLCPFHQEDTPSFTVTPDKQIFYCFGCNAGGNVIKFIMEKEKLHFPDAARYLAEKVGITVPDAGKDNYQDDAFRKREQMYKLNTLVKDFYHYVLNNRDNAKEARDYFTGRSLNSATIEAFQLGFATDSWNSLLNFLTKKGYKPEYLAEVGLVLQKNNGNGYYDRFRNRVIFPIWNEKGQVIGFGGRVLDNSVPKYLNSSESIVFNKGSILYGLNFALEAIREAEQVIIMEGYLDVITAHQHGIKNAVASLGTALTKDHGKLLKRYTNQVIFAYDADQAGVNATIRGMEILQEQGFNIKIVSIPQGKDPDEFITYHGSEAFLELIREKAVSFIEFKLRLALQNKTPKDALEKIKLINLVLPDIAKVSSSILRDEYIKTASSVLNISWDMVNSELSNYSKNLEKSIRKGDKIAKYRNNIEVSFKEGTKVPIEKTKMPIGDARKRAETALLKIILSNPGWRKKVKDNIGWHSFKDPVHKKLLEFLDSKESDEKVYDSAELISYTEDEDIIKIISQLEVQELPSEDINKVVEDCTNLLVETRTKGKKQELLKALAEAEAEKDVTRQLAILKELQQLI